jgi:hypothetical protein
VVTAALHRILTAQFVVAWAGEGGEEPRLAQVGGIRCVAATKARRELVGDGGASRGVVVGKMLVHVPSSCIEWHDTNSITCLKRHVLQNLAH